MDGRLWKLSSCESEWLAMVLEGYEICHVPKHRKRKIAWQATLLNNGTAYLQRIANRGLLAWLCCSNPLGCSEGDDRCLCRQLIDGSGRMGGVQAN